MSDKSKLLPILIKVIGAQIEMNRALLDLSGTNEQARGAVTKASELIIKAMEAFDEALHD